MRKGNKFKQVFFATAAFTILATTGITFTAHADTGSQSYLDQIKQYGIDHGYTNGDGTPGPKVQGQPKKTTIDAKSNKYGYYKDYGNDKSGTSGFTVYQYNQYPSEMRTSYGVNTGSTRNDIYNRVPGQIVYIDGLGMLLQSNGTISGNYQSKAEDRMESKILNKSNLVKTHPELYFVGFDVPQEVNNSNKYVNVSKYYHKWLHININKIITNTQPKNWKSLALNGHKNNYMDKGYTKNWLSEKLSWINAHPEDGKKEMIKYYKQSLLKDQRQTSTKNDFDNTTLK